MARVQAEAADELSPQGKAEPHGGARPAEVDVVWNAELLPGIRDPGLVIAADDETAVALSNARRIAEGGPGADEDLNRVVTARATPEVRRRQAEVLTLLGDHLPELAEVAGDAAALSRLGADADATLLAFSPPDAGLAKTGAAAGNEEQPDDQDAMKESARKVVRAPPPAESAPAAPAGRAYRDVPRRGSEPAFYVVSGPGAIARVERNLAAQNLAFHRVWLTDRPDDDRQRRLEDAAAEYRILEVEVPEAAFDATIGELESLAGLRLAPVGAVRPDASAAPAGRGAGRGGHKAAPLRKLRLVLIPR
jgi:hypothetical protein